MTELIGALLRALPLFPGKNTLARFLLRWAVEDGYRTSVKTKTPVPFVMECQIKDLIPWYVFVHGRYMPEKDEENAMLKLIQPDQVVFDVGANIGYYTIQFAKLGAIVHAFEPFSYQAEILKRQVHANDVEASVTLRKNIVSDSEGQLRIYNPGEHNSGATSVAVISDSYEDVDTVTLDNYTQLHSVDQIDLMKIDVEGHEMSVLKGMQRLLRERSVVHICIEMNETTCTAGGTSKREIDDFLKTFGYSGYISRANNWIPYTDLSDQGLVLYKVA